MEAHLYDSKASELISVRWSLCWVVIIVLGVPDASWIQSASSLEIAHLRLPFTVVKHVPSKTSHLTVNGEVNLASNRNDDSWKSSNWPKVRPAWTVKEVQEGRILIRGDVGAFGFVKPYTVPLICRLDSSAKSCSVFRPKTSGARNQGKGLQLLQGSSSRDWLSLRLQEYAEKADRQRKKGCYLLPLHQKLPLQNFKPGARVLGKVIDVSNARCRVDIGCADAFGHLHVRDMHFLPAALAAGKGIVEGCDFPEKELSILDSAEDRRNLAEDRQLHNVTKLSQDESVVQDWIYSVFSFVKPGDFLQLGIKTIDATKKRIRLTTQPPDSDQHGGPNCKRIPIEGLYVGQKVQGFVLRATEFGVFVDIGATEDGFLPADDLGQNSDKKFKARFAKTARRARRNRLAAADRNRELGSRLALAYSPGQVVKDLVILRIDSTEKKILLTTMTVEAVQALEYMRQQRISGDTDVMSAEGKLYVENAKVRTALKFFERNRKKQGLPPKGTVGECFSRPLTKTQIDIIQGGEITDPYRRWAVLYPDYTADDIDEALELLAAEERRKELILLKERERKAAKQHIRFRRQSADDLSLKEAKQIIKRMPSTVTEEMIEQDAIKIARKAGLHMAEVPIIGPSGPVGKRQVLTDQEDSAKLELDSTVKETQCKGSNFRKTANSKYSEVPCLGGTVNEIEQRIHEQKDAAVEPLRNLFNPGDGSDSKDLQVQEDDIEISPLALEEMVVQEEIRRASSVLRESGSGKDLGGRMHIHQKDTGSLEHEVWGEDDLRRHESNKTSEMKNLRNMHRGVHSLANSSKLPYTFEQDVVELLRPKIPETDHKDPDVDVDANECTDEISAFESPYLQLACEELDRKVPLAGAQHTWMGSHELDHCDERSESALKDSGGFTLPKQIVGSCVPGTSRESPCIIEGKRSPERDLPFGCRTRKMQGEVSADGTWDVYDRGGSPDAGDTEFRSGGTKEAYRDRMSSRTLLVEAARLRGQISRHMAAPNEAKNCDGKTDRSFCSAKCHAEGKRSSERGTVRRDGECLISKDHSKHMRDLNNKHQSVDTSRASSAMVQLTPEVTASTTESSKSSRNDVFSEHQLKRISASQNSQKLAGRRTVLPDAETPNQTHGQNQEPQNGSKHREILQASKRIYNKYLHLYLNS